VTASEIHARVSERETAECMGLRLVPLTLGHARLLDHLGCAGLASASEVALAVLVCSRPQERVLAFLGSPLLPIWLWVWSLALRAWDAEDARSKLDAYLRRHTELPHIIRPESKGGGFRCPIPHHQMIRCVLLSRLNYGPEQIYGTLYLQALWDVSSLDVREGRIAMLDMTDDDMDAMDAGIDWEALEKRAMQKTDETSCSA